MDTTILIIAGFLVAITTGLVFSGYISISLKYKKLYRENESIKKAYRNMDGFIKMQSKTIDDLEMELLESSQLVESLRRKRDKKGRFVSNKKMKGQNVRFFLGDQEVKGVVSCEK